MSNRYIRRTPRNSPLVVVVWIDAISDQAAAYEPIKRYTGGWLLANTARRVVVAGTYDATGWEDFTTIPKGNMAPLIIDTGLTWKKIKECGG